jgi:hypothetical protein
LASFAYPEILGIMEFRTLGGSGFKVPVLSLGTGTFGGRGEFFKAWGASGVEEAKRLVDISLGPASTCSTPPTFTRPAWRKRSSARRSPAAVTR